VTGNLFSLMFSKENELGVGASTSIFSFFGTFIGFVVLNWEKFRKHRYSTGKVVLTIGIILLLNVMMLSSDKSIDNYAHGGGFLAGIALSLVLGDLVEVKAGQASAYEKRVKLVGAVSFAAFVAICSTVCFVFG